MRWTHARFLSALLIAVLLGGCHLWPKELSQLAESLTAKGYGQTKVWLLGGDVLVINVSKSTIYDAPQEKIEAAALQLAKISVESVKTPLESISVTFHQDKTFDDPAKFREFYFFVKGEQLEPFEDIET